MLAVQEALIRCEPIFHRPEHGITRAELESMIADDFWETGASGRRYSRHFVIDAVLTRYAERRSYHSGRTEEWNGEDFHFQMVAPGLYLLTYTRRHGERVSRRPTLWRAESDR